MRRSKSLPPIAWLGAEIYGRQPCAEGQREAAPAYSRANAVWRYFTGARHDAALDQYGNVYNRAPRRRSRSDCQAQFDVLNNSTTRSRQKRLRTRKQFPQFYFSTWPANARTKHLNPGIWQRTHVGEHTAIRPVFLFVYEGALSRAPPV
jgi:hypothetical protein